MSVVERYDPDTGGIHEERVLLPSQGTGMSVVDAEISQQIATARKYPRRKDKIISQEIVERATLNEEIASKCFYSLSRRGGEGQNKAIIGPSIKLADIVAASYGNVRVASRFVRIDDDDKTAQAVIVEAIAMDMQSNYATLKQVRRPIMTSPRGGQPRRFTADMINITIMAAQSIARRNAILELVPEALWLDGYHSAIATTRGDVVTLNDRRKRVIEAFGKFGVKPADLFKSIGVDSETEIGLDHMVELGAMWTSLREGEPADAVLGRAAEARITSEPVANPLAEPPPRSNSSLPTENGGVAPTEIHAGSGATPSSQKINMPRHAPGEPKDAVSDQPAPGQPPPKKNAPTPAPAQEKGPSGEQYLAGALDFIQQCAGATMLRDWYKRQRSAREAAELTADQNDLLFTSYEAKLTALLAI